MDFPSQFFSDDLVTAETKIFQKDTETLKHAKVDAKIEAKLDEELKGDLGSELESKADAKTSGALSSGAVKDSSNKKNLDGKTIVNIKDILQNDVTIEMPEAQKKKITFDSPTLTVIDKDFENPARAMSPATQVK